MCLFYSVWPWASWLTLASARTRGCCLCYDTCSSVLSHARNLEADLCISFRRDVYPSWQTCMKSEQVQHFELLLLNLLDNPKQLTISIIFKNECSSVTGLLHSLLMHFVNGNLSLSLFHSDIHSDIQSHYQNNNSLTSLTWFISVFIRNSFLSFF